MLLQEIERLKLELEAEQTHNLKLRVELEKKSREWKKIKDILIQRKSIRSTLGSLLETPPREPGQYSSPSVFEDFPDAPILRPNLNDSNTKSPETPSNIVPIDLKDPSEKENNCPCCSKFFEAVEDLNTPETKRLRKCKHKSFGACPSTPPGFWSVGFTQHDQ